MDSSYVEIDQEQQQWLSNLSFDQIAGRPGIAHEVDFHLTRAGHVEHGVYETFADTPVHDNIGQWAQNQYQPARSWSNDDAFQFTGYQVGAGGYASAPSAMMFLCSDSYLDADIPMQTHSTQPSHSTWFTDCTSGDTLQSDVIARVPSISPNPRLSANSFELTVHSSNLEAKRIDPPMVLSIDGAMPRPQNPRFVGDEYAAAWVRGSGVERSGWCGLCPTWHKLKDSQYWYHVCKVHRL